MKIVTCTAPINIAVVKYWGKRDSSLILPINDSVSATLSQDQLCAKTSAAASHQFSEDRIWLNGQEESIENVRLQKCLSEIRRRCRKRKHSDTGGEDKHFSEYHVHICSENNFPTAAGLASSAAGYACLVYTLAQLFNVEGDISAIARQGSGSACRSVMGGFVRWLMGSNEDGSDSIAEQVVSETHWPELRVLVCVTTDSLILRTGSPLDSLVQKLISTPVDTWVSDQKKKTSSSIGMDNTVKTSALMDYRATHVVPSRMTKIIQAVKDRNFEAFAVETMKDSNQLHATCLDTYPPIFYLNDTSKDIITMVHQYNSYCKQIKVAYTFDAGPNACLFTLEEDVPELYALVQRCFPTGHCHQGQQESMVKGMDIPTCPLPEELKGNVTVSPATDRIKYIIHTKVGEGPRIMADEGEHLLGPDGMPTYV